LHAAVAWFERQQEGRYAREEATTPVWSIVLIAKFRGILDHVVANVVYVLSEGENLVLRKDDELIR
jgi:hypothetical protein